MRNKKSIPAAQFPLAVPLFAEHSELVKHVPNVVEELTEVHSSFWNCTMENNENNPEKMPINLTQIPSACLWFTEKAMPGKKANGKVVLWLQKDSEY